MKVKFWGVRGSIPVPGPETARYGGNTSCLEISGKNGECIILDSGTGIRELGQDLMKRGSPLPKIHLLISHTHWDHIQGFPFFSPCYIPGTPIDIKGPVHYHESRSIRDVFDIQMQYEFFPISNRQLDADIHYKTLDETAFKIGKIRVNTQFTNHPVRCLAYRLEENGRAMVYACDHEPYYNLFKTDNEGEENEENLLFAGVDETVKAANERFVDFLQGADLLVLDSQYTPEEYPALRRNWGHSSWDYCLEWKKAAGADRLVLTHHEPLRTDEQLDEIYVNVCRTAQEMGMDPEKIVMSKEGMELSI